MYLCLKCLQKVLCNRSLLAKVRNYDYDDWEFPATIIRYTPFRKYWREKCTSCDRSPQILIKIDDIIINNPEKTKKQKIARRIR